MKTDGTDPNSDDSEMTYDDMWILKFLDRRENKHLERVHDNFLCDRFNFNGIREKVKDFESAYGAIQDRHESTNLEIESTVYLLAHQRYIYTKSGLDSIFNKVLNREFGACHQYGCEDVPFVPTALSNEPKKSGTMLFCHNCESLYEPRGSLRNLDGCAWGIGFAHFLILSYPYHFEKRARKPAYTPRIFGIQLYKRDDNDSG